MRLYQTHVSHDDRDQCPYIPDANLLSRYKGGFRIELNIVRQLTVRNCIIVKREIVERHPWVPLNLYKAFSESIKLSAHADHVRPYSYRLSRQEQKEVIGADFLPIGLKRNRRALEHFLALAREQGWVVKGQALTLEDLFHESTIYT